MKIVGLIAEYNPFHNGHFYHIEEAKKQAGAEYAVVVMSGNFVQRGEPACIDKFIRAEMAVRSGADIVFELPAVFATASAEYFASGAVSLLNRLGCIDTLCFGSEWGQIDEFSYLASILVKEPEIYRQELTDLLRAGKPFPKARESALSRYLDDSSDQLSSLVSSPNNILGLEYMKALQKSSSSITPFTIKRKESNYHDSSLSITYSSATALRTLLNSADFPTALFSQVPTATISNYKDAFHHTGPILADHFESLLSYRLLSEDAHHLKSYFGMPSSLANRIMKTNFVPPNFQERIASLKTREITYTGICRALMHVLLNITNDSMVTYCANGFAQYARLLACKKSSTFLLRRMAEEGSIPLLTKVANAPSLLTPLGMKMLSEDIYCSNIYNTIVHQIYGTVISNDYQHPIFFG